MRSFSMWASTATLGAALFLGCGGTEGYGELKSFGVGGGAPGTGSGATTGPGSGAGGASGVTSGASGATGGNGATTAASGNGATTGTGAPPATFSVSTEDPSVDLDLADTASIPVLVTATGDVGTIILSAEGLPQGVSAEFSPESVTLDGAGSETVTLTLTSKSSAQVGEAPFGIVADGPSDDEIADALVTVSPVITIEIPPGVLELAGDGTYLEAYGPYPILITAPPPVTVYFYNADGIPHEIHTDSGEGFSHSEGPINPQSMDPLVRSLNGSGQYDWYLHDQGAPVTPGRIVLQ